MLCHDPCTASPAAGPPAGTSDMARSAGFSAAGPSPGTPSSLTSSVDETVSPPKGLHSPSLCIECVSAYSRVVKTRSLFCSLRFRPHSELWSS